MKTSRHNFFPDAPLRAARDGSVLVVVMWIVFGLISITLYFANSMVFDLRAADNRAANIEAAEAIEGARRYITCVLSNLNGPGVIPDPQSYLREAVPVGKAKFWLIGRTNSDSLTPSTLTFGLIDEASKLNLNATNLVNTNLAMLPRMTLELAYNIMAWENTNTANSYGGAESDTYQRLQPPYLCKNAPFETVDELRLIYQMDVDVLYGEDANLNGALDPNENDGDVLPPSDNSDGRLGPGILEYVTVYSHLPATQTNGQPLVNVANGVAGLQTNLVALFGQSRAAQIVARVGGAALNGPLQFYMASGMTAAEFQQIEPIIRGPNTNGLININTASAAVLQCLPGMDTNQATQLVSYRQSIQSDPNNQNTIAWVTQVLQPQTLALISPYITGRTYQFTADVAAVGHNGRGYQRVRFVFDTSSGSPVIVHRQDLTHLGWALGKDARDKLIATK